MCKVDRVSLLNRLENNLNVISIEDMTLIFLFYDCFRHHTACTFYWSYSYSMHVLCTTYVYSYLNLHNGPENLKKSRQKNSWNQINQFFFSWNCISGSFKLFPSSKIDFLLFLKLQKLCFCTFDIALFFLILEHCDQDEKLLFTNMKVISKLASCTI